MGDGLAPSTRIVKTRGDTRRKGDADFSLDIFNLCGQVTQVDISSRQQNLWAERGEVKLERATEPKGH